MQYRRIAELSINPLLIKVYNVCPVRTLVPDQSSTMFPRKLFHVWDCLPSNNTSMSVSISSTMNDFHSFKIL